jgi:hypothetical protein
MKKTLFAIGSILGFWLILSTFSPSSVRVTRTQEIYAPADSVFNQFNTIKNWKNWSYWERADSGMVSNYKGPDSGVGAVHQWQSEEMGNGSITIIESTRPTSIKYELVLEGMSPSIGSVSLMGRGNDLVVTMELQMALPFMFRPFGLLADRMIGPDFEDSLTGLKKICDTNQP